MCEKKNKNDKNDAWKQSLIFQSFFISHYN